MPFNLASKVFLVEYVYMKQQYSVLSESEIISPNNKKHRLVDATIATPDGKQVCWQYVKTRDVVTIVPITDKNEVYCVKQWRPARKSQIWELPAGGIEEESATIDQVLANANRELQEELGIRARKIQVIATFSPGAHIASINYVVLARDFETSKLPGDDHEDLDIKILPFKDAYQLLINSQIPTAMTLVGMALARDYIK